MCELTLGALLSKLDQMADFKGLEDQNTVIMINKKLSNAETTLQHRDEILIIQPIAGG